MDFPPQNSRFRKFGCRKIGEKYKNMPAIETSRILKEYFDNLSCLSNLSFLMNATLDPGDELRAAGLRWTDAMPRWGAWHRDFQTPGKKTLASFLWVLVGLGKVVFTFLVCWFVKWRRLRDQAYIDFPYWRPLFWFLRCFHRFFLCFCRSCRDGFSTPCSDVFDVTRILQTLWYASCPRNTPVWRLWNQRTDSPG